MKTVSEIPPIFHLKNLTLEIVMLILKQRDGGMGRTSADRMDVNDSKGK